MAASPPSPSSRQPTNETSTTIVVGPPRWVTIAVVACLLILPLLVGWVYRSWTLPGTITIGGGPEGGRYRVLANALGDEIESRLDVEARVLESTGSMENLRNLRGGVVDFAIVQGDVAFASSGHESDELSFVCNLYSEILHVVVRREAGIVDTDDLRGRTISIGKADSGDRSTAVMLLDHLGLSRDEITAREYDYASVKRHFADGTLDAALITSSPRAPILRDLLDDGRCDVIDVPFAEALARRELAVAPFVVPAGIYRSREPHEPPHDVRTVAVRSQLLCRSDLPTRLVSNVAQLVTDKQFVKRNKLAELYRDGVPFAAAKPTFEVHPGAERVFDPAMRPLLDPDFVEATEGIRSFAVSLLIGLFLLYRWLRERRLRREEHRLDRYIRKLLRIEQRQTALDDGPEGDDLVQLQTLLDELTRLRQEALQDFSAHELREDRATDCFLEMCHALSDKINAKITRQRIERSLALLGDRLTPSRTGAPQLEGKSEAGGTHGSDAEAAAPRVVARPGEQR